MKTSAIRGLAAQESEVAGESAIAMRQDISMIGHVQVSLVAQVGTVSLSVERLFALQAGEVICMNELLDAPVTLMLNGKPVARAELLAVEDHFGVRILELA